MDTPRTTRVIEGAWEEIAAEAEKHSGKRFRLLVLNGDTSSSEKSDAPSAPQGVRATFGMFPQLDELTEEDFDCAEWRGEHLGAL